MVTVTQTKSSDLLAADDDLPSHPLSATDYVVVSEDLIVTPSCLARVEQLLQQRNQGETDDNDKSSFLRVYVDAGGCSGFQYQFELDQEFDEEEDRTLITSAIDGSKRIVTDEASLAFLKGSTLDYVQEMIRSSFAVIDNPQSESACGCGSSFAVKNFAENPALD